MSFSSRYPPSCRARTSRAKLAGSQEAYTTRFTFETASSAHWAAAPARGMTGEPYAQLLAIVGLAPTTNHPATAPQVPVDAAFDAQAR